MAMTTCGECGKEISTTAKACPNCGASRSNPAGKILKWTIVVLLALIAIAFFGILAGNSPEAKERQRARNTIRTCWDEQSKKSLSAEMAQTVASVCEQMESDYEKKYGSKP